MVCTSYIRYFQPFNTSKLPELCKRSIRRIWASVSGYKITRKLGFAFLAIVFSACEKDIFVDRSGHPEYIFDSFWHEVDRNYSFFYYTGLNWDSVYTTNRPLINSNTSDNELFKILSNITDLLNDAHTNLYTPFGVAGNINYFNRYPVNRITLTDSYFEFYNISDKVFEFGKLKSSNLGYIRIKTFEGDNADFNKIDSVLNILDSTQGLIVDVRSNKGGNISNARIIASKFADSARLACKYRIRNGPLHNDFSAWIDVYIDPSTNTPYYHKPVAVLTNRRSYSATEWFVMFTDVLPNVILVGDTTGGGSGIPLVRELPNGWLIRTSNTQTITPSGRDFQFTGIYPDVPVWISSGDLKGNIDTILEKAISVLSGI